MKKIVLFTVLLTFSALSMLTAADVNYPVLPSGTKMQHKVLKSEIHKHQSLAKTGDFVGGVIFQEDFEGTQWHRWTTEDLTNPFPVPNKWHVTTWNALADSSWWMADTSFGTNGGYDNAWYQVLDTDPFVLTDSTATLTFYHRYALEDPAGAEDPYNGWDAINVRISSDSGKTWTVLDNGTYSATSMYSFGYQHGEGPNVPGWGGTMDTWTKEVFDLKGTFELGAPVMIRFAFASDPAYSTNDGAPDLFGWQLDSIEVVSLDTVRFANYGETAGMSGKSVAFVPPKGEDLWHEVTFSEALPAYAPEFVPSGTHGAVLQNGGDTFSMDSTYNPYMDNVMTTGPIALPDTTPIYLDFNHMPYFVDDDAFPEVEYWRPEVTAVDTDAWEAVWIGDNGEQWVFSDGLDQWIGFSYMWGGITNMSPLDLSRYAGQDVYLRWRFWSDEDQPMGPGLMFDDVVVYAPINPPAAPTGLAVEGMPEDTTIVVTWDADEGKTFQVWRTTPGDQYLHLLAETTDNKYVDEDVEFFQEYYYTLKATVKYEGTSDFVDPMLGTQIVPPTIREFGYDDGVSDTTVVADPNKLVYVKFTPNHYPVDVKGLNIFLVKDGTGTAAQFSMWDDDGEDGMPGTQLRIFNKSGMPEGWYKIIFDDSTAIDSGSVWVGYKRYGGGPAAGRMVGADTTGDIKGNTYLQTDSTLFHVTDRDAMVHLFLDTARVELTGIEKYKDLVTNDFVLGRNYPNPFNPVTTIPFVVPARAAGEVVTLSVYNILGQKVATLFNGKARAGFNAVNWNGLNEANQPVGSGVYIYRLSGKNVSIANRMLLMK